MTCLFNIQDSLDPGNNFMGARIGWLIHIDNTIFKIVLKWSFEWGGSCGNRGVVVGEDIHLVVILQQ